MGPTEPSAGARPAKLDRRQLLAAGGLCAASCGAGVRLGDPAPTTPLDALFAAHADRLPEHPGAGANHYPMAAEVLEAFGRAESIEPAWFEDGAARYPAARLPAVSIATEADRGRALGDYEYYAAWLQSFRTELERSSWQGVLAQWAPSLAPGLCAAAFHGLIRTGHAVRALGVQDTAARRGELAVGLAYWAACYTPLPTTEETPDRRDLRLTLTGLEHPWLANREEVDFFGVGDRLRAQATTPQVELRADFEPQRELDSIVHEAALAFLEMLVLERHRIWLLHTVTGPAALDWILPTVDRRTGQLLVAYARQAVVAMYAAFGEPYSPGQHLRTELSPWPELIQRAVETRSVHGLKLIDALARFDRDSHPVWRSVAEQWFEWT